MNIHHPVYSKAYEVRSPRIIDISKIVAFHIDDCIVVFHDRGGKDVNLAVRETFFCRAIPRVGDYVVTYNNGYVTHRTHQELKRDGFRSDVKSFLAA